MEKIIRKLNQASPLDEADVRRSVLKLKRHVLADIDKIMAAVNKKNGNARRREARRRK